MKILATVTAQHEVEISDADAMKIAERAIRIRFGLADAVEISPAGLLRAWQRDGHGDIEAVDGLPASAAQIEALQVINLLRNA